MIFPQKNLTTQISLLLETLDNESLGLFLASETNPAIACALSMVEPARAARLLKGLGDQRAAAVLEFLSRSSDQQQLSLEALREEILNWIEKHKGQKPQPPLKNKTAALMSALDSETQKRILEEMRQKESQTAKDSAHRIESEMQSFEKLFVLQPGQLAQVFSDHCDDDLILFVFTFDPDQKKALQSCVSKARWDRLILEPEPPRLSPAQNRRLAEIKQKCVKSAQLKGFFEDMGQTWV